MNLRVGFLKPNRLWPLSDRNEVEQMNKITQTKKRAAILAGAQPIMADTLATAHPVTSPSPGSILAAMAPGADIANITRTGATTSESPVQQA